jgi:hypothetical protein
MADAILILRGLINLSDVHCSVDTSRLVISTCSLPVVLKCSGCKYIRVAVVAQDVIERRLVQLFHHTHYT